MRGIIFDCLPDHENFKNGLKAFRQELKSDPDVIAAMTSGNHLQIVKAPGGVEVDLTWEVSNRFLEEALKNWYFIVELALRKKGKDKVCGISLYELTKEALFYHLQTSIFPFWTANQFLKSFPLDKVRFVRSQTSGPSRLETSLEQLSKVSGQDFRTLLNSSEPVFSFTEPIWVRLQERLNSQIRWLQSEAFRRLPSFPRYATDGIMFSAFYSTNMWQLLAIRDTLPAKAREHSIVFGGNFKVEKALRKDCFDVIGLTQFSDISLVSEARHLKQEFVKALRTIKYEDIPVGSLKERIYQSAKVWLCEHYYDIVWSVLTNMRVLKELRPAAITTTTQWGIYAKAHIMVAKLIYQIPTLWIQHGLATIDAFTAPLYFDQLAVWGERDIALWSGVDFPKDRIKITGGITFDPLVKLSGKETVRHRLGIPLANAVITYTSQPVHSLISVEEHRETFKWFLQAAATLRDAVFILKPHPRENEKIYRTKVEAAKLKNVLVQKQVDTDELIKGSDIIVTIYSTTGMTAVGLNKPLIMLEHFNGPDRAAYVREKVAVRARSAEELIESIRLLLTDTERSRSLTQNRAAFIKNYMMPKFDGQAAARCGELVLQLANLS